MKHLIFWSACLIVAGGIYTAAIAGTDHAPFSDVRCGRIGCTWGGK